MSPVICVHCRQPYSAHFDITRFDKTGTNQGTVSVCSLMCLIKWGYEFATLSGMRIAYTAKTSFDKFIDGLSALRGKS